MTKTPFEKEVEKTQKRREDSNEVDRWDRLIYYEEGLKKGRELTLKEVIGMLEKGYIHKEVFDKLLEKELKEVKK